MKKTLRIALLVIFIIALASSGWVYNIVAKNNQLVRSNEMATLQTTFVQQYGSGAVIKQLVAPEKVYAALWTSTDNITRVSWNIGGLWVLVWSENSPNTIP